MRHYSLRFLSDTGRVIRRYDFQATNDQEASGAANAVIGSSQGELRLGQRIVTVWNARPEERRAARGAP